MMARSSFVVLLLLASCAPSDATTYYVDWAQGSDTAAGTSGTAPWKHAPGDPGATAVPASTRLGPGDRVLFKGGVAYRGEIKLASDGSDGQPITFSGKGYGSGSAIFDGADPVRSAVPCPSADACGGAQQWQKLVLVTFDPPPTSLIKFYDAKGPLTEGQLPAPKDPFYADDVEGYFTSSLGDKGEIEKGRLHSQEIARALAGRAQGELSIWIAGNQVARRAITGVDGNTILFAPDGIKLYDNRDGRFALAGTALAISGPGQYAVIGPGKAVIWPNDGGGALLIGNGRGGIDIAGHSHVAISDLVFEHQTGAAEDGRGGLPVSQQSGNASDIAITGNVFRNSALWNGQGAITLKSVDGARVEDNLIETIERGSGLRSGFQVANVHVVGNTIRRVGRTGIAFLGVADSSIENNVIEGLRGIHGNGISVYLNNRRVLVAGNRVSGTTRPMTYHGDKSTTAPGDHDLVIERNLFLSIPDGYAALTSWGAATRNVTIRYNVAVAPRSGLLLDRTDSGVIATDNIISSTTLKGNGDMAGWKIENNHSGSDSLIGKDDVPVAALCKTLGLAPGTILGAKPC